MSGGGTSQPNPGCFGAAPSGHRRAAEVDHDEGKTGIEEQLGSHQCGFNVLGANPKETRKIDSSVRGGLWIESVAEVDQAGDVATACECGQGLHEDGEATAGATADDLDQSARL